MTPDDVPGSSPLERLLGITDRRGWITPLWQSFVVGTVFVVVSLLGYHAPQPRDVPVVIAGPVASSDAVERAAVVDAPGAFRFSRAAPEDGLAALRRGDVFAVVDLTGAPTVRYAGAQGPTVFAELTHTVVPAVAVTTATTPILVDALPLGPDDAAALPLFYLTFAVVLSSYLFAVTTTTQARRLRAWGHWTSAAALAVALGLVGSLVARFGTHTITAHTPTVAALLALTSLGTGAGAFLLLRVSTTVGGVLGTVVLVILGSASGGVVPGQFLPVWLAVLRPILPMGAGLGGIRDVVYFGGHGLPAAVLVLVVWAVGPLLVATALKRRSGPSTDTATLPEPDHAAAPVPEPDRGR